MTDEIKHAFAHPEKRSVVDAPMRDRISLRDHIVEVEIGAFQSERGVTQRLAFNIVVEVRPTDADDDVDLILSYDTITEAIAHELAAERLNLLETLADRVAVRILAEPLAERVFVRIEKLDRGPGKLGVEIVRGGSVQTPAESETLHPIVVCLSHQAATSENVTVWLDQLRGADHPVVLCVGAQDVPQAANSTAQYRVDLLAIEQAAWQLSARDPRCVVVDSRTELDWGMKHGQLSVWAPSKIVVDIVEDVPASDPVSLAAWLADSLGARELVIVGAENMPGAQVPARIVSVDDTSLF